jgi:LuxR family maltose regulon positive regulatory protein
MKALLMQAVQRNVVPTYVARPLRAFTDSSGATPGSMPIAEALSDRERDVLRLLVAGCSGPEIAETLVVAPSTVRTHVKSIYGKLDVHTREQAIARATELKFL